MYLVGPSGSGKTVFINDMLRMKTFQPSFDRILYFYKHFQAIYDTMIQSITDIEFIQGVDFDLIDNLPADGTKYLLIFDDSLDILSKSEKFNGIATAGRHRNLNCVYIKHNLFHKNKTGRDAELQTTHIVLFKSPRDVQQIDILGRQLGLGTQLKQWYDDATQESFGHLMIDLRPSTPDLLRYCSNVTSFHQNSLYRTVVLVLLILMINAQNYYTLKLFRNLSKKFQPAFLLNCPKEFIRFL